MSQWVNKPDVKTARCVCLYDFLLSRHPNEVELEGNSLRLCCKHSVSIKEGYAGFRDFSDEHNGNSIDCLVEYFDYEFPDAVAALCEFDRDQGAHKTRQNPLGTMRPHTPSNAANRPQTLQRAFTPPEPVQGRYWHLFAYLTQQRGIPSALVQILINDGLLYQEKEHNNMVFINPSRTFAELRGSNSFRPFHQVAFSDPAEFWWFKPRGVDTTATVAYVCEGAIDAISLYLLLARDRFNHAERGLYCGIGGVANQQRIDLIKAYAAEAEAQTIIAVDNDEAGEKCRQRNSECKAIIPRPKDWNEQLLQREAEFLTYDAGCTLVELLDDTVKRHRKKA